MLMNNYYVLLLSLVNHPLEQFLVNGLSYGPELVLLTDIASIFTIFGYLINANWVLFSQLIFVVCLIQIFIRRLTEGHTSVRTYGGLVYRVFTMVLIFNLLGAVPYMPTATSHIVFTFLLGNSVFWGTFITMASAHGIRAIGSLQPAGAPDAMMPFLIIIESISFFARGISISVRLFANMLSGHILVKIVLSFLLVIAFSTLQSGITGIMQFLIVILIVGATSAIICLETVVALLQSYVFSILTCSYIQDSVTIH